MTFKSYFERLNDPEKWKLTQDLKGQQIIASA